MADTKAIKIEREYIIPLRRAWVNVPEYKRARKAVMTIKKFIARHMKVDDRNIKNVKLDVYLNNEIWFRGHSKPPAKIKVKAIKEGDIVKVELFELPNDLKFKKVRLEKRDKKAMEIAEKKKSTIERLKEARENKEEAKVAETPEEAKEKEEKKEANVEATEKLEKEMAKSEKHETKAKSPKQVKNDRVGYNQSSRGR